MKVVPVLMSGGAGTRLWPASRSDRPKQFLPLVDDRTMVRATLDRLGGLAAASPLVVANAAHAELVRAELATAGYDEDRVILEPFGRNTAPAAAVAALELMKGGADPLMLLLPADHVIDDVPAFHEAAEHACALAAAGNLVTFGIVPTNPETGYGYIRAGEPIDDAAATVAEFVEKPDLATAERYLTSGEYFWNSGMFVFRCSDYLAALEEFAPEMKKACETTMDHSRRERGVHLDEDSFSGTPADSIDYAVMENTNRAVVIPLDAGWSDVGSWTALWEIARRDEAGNVLIGDVTATGTTNSYVRADGRLVTVAGVDNIVVVDTPDALLVTTLDKAQLVKNIVERLKDEGRPEATGSE
ncbi:MAG: mannose-1-phosphate guanylyltransferase/mannose-6-phosphate isomerase [Acidimicrobiia bacterium]|nr:mannose-1-phosphate guanylyltransferase/mannose-6-phosphate isomerase [Acidimicrobiia bacterium]